jgi:IS30 family transposase
MFLPQNRNTEETMMPYTHFTITERECLAEKLKEGKSLRQIAKELGKDVSSISREYNRNKNKNGAYHPWRATSLYLWRRKKCVRKLRLMDKTVNDFVTKGLEQFWSPEIISARWKMEHPGIPLSFTTIYRSIKSGKLPKFKPKTHLRRHGKRKNKGNSQTIKPIHKIADRPSIIEERTRLGDLEGDTVYGSQGKGCVLTNVDRTSRFLYAQLAKSRHKEVIAEAFEKSLTGVDVKSITLDNGSEFADFPNIEKKLNTTIFFADRHAPWQRGSNENINGLLRFFFPKGTNFHKVSDDELQKAVSIINNRPRKCLGWLSPLEFISSKCCT